MSVTPSSSRPPVSQSSVRRSLPTPPTRTPAKHRRNKSWRKIFERFNRSSSLRIEIQYPGEFCNMRVCWILCRLDHSIVIVTTLHKYKLLSCPRHPSHSPTSFVSPCYSMYTLCTQAWGPGLSGQRPDIDTTMLHVTEDWDALIDIYSLSNWTWSWCCNLQFCASMAPTPRWGECLISTCFPEHSIEIDTQIHLLHL